MQGAASGEQGRRRGWLRFQVPAEAFVQSLSSSASSQVVVQSHTACPSPRGIIGLKYLATSLNPLPRASPMQRPPAAVTPTSWEQSWITSLERRRQRGPLGAASRFCGYHPVKRAPRGHHGPGCGVTKAVLDEMLLRGRDGVGGTRVNGDVGTHVDAGIGL
ncbi:hypothetical protein BU16DRAFT_556809 [Lophium mytilinum]|uniref:Uncharacterized protein n=1 Tax=Lophium mytilinum TaxID=390894 RepID=A0A6A6R7H9_9PEZI|nr:hypothetical protein BU16DRAFT_556809 [Lophium mytilinum]